jgi:hypothetical protein
VWDFCSSASSSELRFLKRSRCAVTIGRMPKLLPIASPARKDASGLCELLSKPEIIEDVGDERPQRAEDCR